MQRLHVRVFGACERRIGVEQLTDRRFVSLVDRDEKGPGVRAPVGLVEVARPLDRLDVAFELGPACEAILLSKRILRVGERGGIGSCLTSPSRRLRAQARDRRGLARPHVPQKVLGLLAELHERRTCR
jgi:hypothetical protein